MLWQATVALVFFSCFFAVNGQYECDGGACHITSHAFVHPIEQKEITYAEPTEVKEWHFHVYFFQDNNISVEAAMNLRDSLLNQVKNHYFVAVFDGITEDYLPGINVTAIPPINMGPRGPHPCGSFEVWVPIEYVGRALSYFMLNHGELTILVHPLTRHELEDHVGRTMWLGPPYRIDVTVLKAHGIDTPEYPELELGYHAPVGSEQNVGCEEGKKVSSFAPCVWQSNGFINSF